MLQFDGRITPFHKAHSTELAGMHVIIPAAIIAAITTYSSKRANLSPYDSAPLPLRMDGNVFLKDSKPSKHEKNPLVKPEFDVCSKLVEKADGFYLEIKLDKAWSAERTRRLVTTSLLGKAQIPGLPYENPDGSPLKIDTDYFGKMRNAANPAAGPFENAGDGPLSLKVW